MTGNLSDCQCDVQESTGSTRSIPALPAKAGGQSCTSGGRPILCVLLGVDRQLFESCEEAATENAIIVELHKKWYIRLGSL